MIWESGKIGWGGINGIIMFQTPTSLPMYLRGEVFLLNMALHLECMNSIYRISFPYCSSLVLRSIWPSFNQKYGQEKEEKESITHQLMLNPWQLQCLNKHCLDLDGTKFAVSTGPVGFGTTPDPAWSKCLEAVSFTRAPHSNYPTHSQRFGSGIRIRNLL